jgi:hypothetical protein
MHRRADARAARGGGRDGRGVMVCKAADPYAIDGWYFHSLTKNVGAVQQFIFRAQCCRQSRMVRGPTPHRPTPSHGSSPAVCAAPLRPMAASSCGGGCGLEGLSWLRRVEEGVDGSAAVPATTKSQPHPVPPPHHVPRAVVPVIEVLPHRRPGGALPLWRPGGAQRLQQVLRGGGGGAGRAAAGRRGPPPFDGVLLLLLLLIVVAVVLLLMMIAGVEAGGCVCAWQRPGRVLLLLPPRGSGMADWAHPALHVQGWLLLLLPLLRGRHRPQRGRRCDRLGPGAAAAAVWCGCWR